MRKIHIVFTTLILSLCAVENATAGPVDTNTQKTVLVTGASSGIGKQIAVTLAANGYYVYAGARKSADIIALTALDNIEGIRLDVTVQKDIDDAVLAIRKKGRGLYGLVNNAGVFLFDPLIEVSEEDLQFIMDVNVFGPYRVTKSFAPLIIESQGHITTIGSIAGLTAGQLFGPYSMTKHAIEAFSESLALEMAKFDVGVSIVEPGNFKSDIMKNMQERLQLLQGGQRQSQYQAEIERFAGFAAVDRSQHASPTPVADAVLHSLHDDNPQFRYLITPNSNEARFAVTRSIQKAVQLNQGQPFALDRDDLVKALDASLAEQP